MHSTHHVRIQRAYSQSPPLPVVHLTRANRTPKMMTAAKPTSSRRDNDNNSTINHTIKMKQ